MAKTAKLWTSLGVAVLAGSITSQAAPLNMKQSIQNVDLVLVDGEGGEGGATSEGGEGGGSTTTYSIDSTDENAFKYDASVQIDAYVNHVFKSYEKAADDAKLLQAAVDAFLNEPTQASLDAARKAWLDARPAYLHTEAFRFYDGPIDAVEGDINSWPMNEAFIDYVEGKPEAGIVNDTRVDLNFESIVGSNQKTDEADVTIGWHAIEFLLWGQDLSSEGPDNRPYTDYIKGQGNNDRRRTYLKLITEKLAAQLHDLEEKWEMDEPGSYAKTFKTLPQREAIGRIVNGMAILAGYEFMSERLAVALDSGDQEDEHSCFSDSTKQDYVHDLVGIKAVWTEAKLNELIASRDPELAKKVDALFADTETKVAALGDPWDKVLASPKDSDERKDAEAVVASLGALAEGLKKAGNKLGVLVLIPGT